MSRTHSHNSLSTFRTCPRKYSFQYLEKVSVPKTVSADLYLGNAVHRALEKLYSVAAAGRVLLKKEFVELYLGQWEKTERRAISVPSEYNTVDDYIERGKLMLEQYYDKFHPFDGGILLGAEFRIRFRLAETPFEFVALIDKLWKRPDSVVEICDYKTGRKLPQGGRDPRFYLQMGLYQLAVEDKFPDFGPIELVQHFVGLDEFIRYSMSAEEMEMLREELRATVIAIKEAQRLNQFVTHEGTHCHYCDFQPYCPAKRHRLQLEKESGHVGHVGHDGHDGAELTTAEHARELADKYLRVTQDLKIKQAEKEALKADLVRAAKDLGVERFYGREGSVLARIGKEEKFVTRSEDQDEFAELSALARQLGLDGCFELNGKSLMKEVYRTRRLSDDQHEQLSGFVRLKDSTRITPNPKKRPGPEDD